MDSQSMTGAFDRMVAEATDRELLTEVGSAIERMLPRDVDFSIRSCIMSGLSAEFRTIALIYYSTGILENGGLNYFFAGDTARYGIDIAQAFELVGAKPAGAAIRHIMGLLPISDSETDSAEWFDVLLLTRPEVCASIDEQLSKALSGIVASAATFIRLRANAFSSLSNQIYWPTVEDLTRDLRHAEPWNRSEAARRLGLLKAPVCVPDLMSAARDDDEMVRDRAVEALGKMGVHAASAVDVIVQSLLSEESEDNRRTAAEALGMLGPSAASAVNGLCSALQDCDWGVRMRAALAIGQIGACASLALPALVGVLERNYPSGDEGRRDEERAVRTAVVTAIGEFGPDALDCVSTLRVAALDEHESVRIAAAVSIRRLTAK